MNAQLLSLARRFDADVQSVDFLTRCLNTIYKAANPGRTFVLRLTAQPYRTKEQLEGEWAFQRYLCEQGRRLPGRWRRRTACIFSIARTKPKHIM